MPDTKLRALLPKPPQITAEDPRSAPSDRSEHAPETIIPTVLLESPQIPIEPSQPSSRVSHFHLHVKEWDFQASFHCNLNYGFESFKATVLNELFLQNQRLLDPIPANASIVNMWILPPDGRLPSVLNEENYEAWVVDYHREVDIGIPGELGVELCWTTETVIVNSQTYADTIGEQSTLPTALPSTAVATPRVPERRNGSTKAPDSRSVSLISRQLAQMGSQMTPSSPAPTQVTPSSPAPAVSKPPEISQVDGVHEEPLIQPEATSHCPSQFHRLWNATKQSFHSILAKLYAGWRRLPDTPDDQVDGYVKGAEQGEQGEQGEQSEPGSASIPIPDATGSPSDPEEITLHVHSEFTDYYHGTFPIRLEGYSYSMADGVFSRLVLQSIREQYADHELWLHSVFIYEAWVYTWSWQEHGWSPVARNRSGIHLGAGFRPYHYMLAQGPGFARVWLRWAIG
ncbi:MAG: hypothetical protein Q9182_002324 [Xanthomendoza sp. 2 TL-2023]